MESMETHPGLEDFGWAEAIGFKCLVHFLSTYEQTPRHFTIYGDNNGVVEGWGNGRSKNRQINNVFRRLHLLAASPPGHSFHTRYVPSKDNPADGPSRGIYPPDALLLPPISLPLELHRFVIDSQLPYTAIEQRSLREGYYPSAVAKRIQNDNEQAQERLQLSTQLPHINSLSSQWQ